MADAIQLLQQLNFSEYEARAYTALLQRNPVNGYTLAKESGIPRANIYSVLQKLEERGAVFAIETGSGTTYTPVPPDVLVHRLSTHIEGVLQAAHESLVQVAQPVEQTYVQNIQGYAPLLEHAHDLIQSAVDNLLIALWQPEALALADALAAADARGVRIDILCFQACAQECGSCRGQLYRYHVTPGENDHRLFVIADGADMLAATTGQQAIAIRTQQPGLIDVAASYIRHSLALAAVLTDLGTELEEQLQPETRALLNSIGQGTSWLDTIRDLLEN